MATGKVRFVSRNGAMIVVAHDAGFTIVELIGDEGEIGVGDTVFGNWQALGGEPIRKAGENHAFDGYYQGCWASLEAEVQVARNTGGG